LAKNVTLRRQAEEIDDNTYYLQKQSNLGIKDCQPEQVKKTGSFSALPFFFDY